MHQRLCIGGARLAIAGALMWVAALGTTVHAETIYYYEPHTGYHETVDTANPGRHASLHAPHAVVESSGRGGNLVFSVTYTDVTSNTNVGFDDPSLGATRQATLLAVLSYVNDTLGATSGATIDVTVNASQTDGTGFLASAGTFFTGTTEFTNGFCFQHISTGTDPNGSVEDIFATVDFGFTWNSDTGPVTGGEYDLYTVMLHEITHGLGFLNLTDPDGTSTISPGGNPGQYSIVNQLTQLDDAGPVGTGSSTALWTTAMTASYVGTAGNLTSDRLVFTGTNAVAAFGSNPTINSSGTFVVGTSLGHWGNDLIGAAVMPGSIFIGTEFREYAAFEIGALKDLGYSNASGGSPPAPPDADNDFLSDAVETDTGLFVSPTDTGSDPNDPDSDNDGVMDGIEVALGTDPNDALDFPILPLSVTLALAAILSAAGVMVLARMRRKVSRTR